MSNKNKPGSIEENHMAIVEGRKYADGQLLFRPDRQSVYFVDNARFIDTTQKGEERNDWLYTCMPICQDKRLFTSYYQKKIDEQMQPVQCNVEMSKALFKRRKDG